MYETSPSKVQLRLIMSISEEEREFNQQADGKKEDLGSSFCHSFNFLDLLLWPDYF